MSLFFVIFSITIGANLSLACKPDACKTITCTKVDASSCEGVFNATGGLCGCCPRCESYKKAGQFCGSIPLARMQPQCGPGLVCRSSDWTCQPLSTSQHGPVRDLRAGEYCGPLISVSQRSCDDGLHCVDNFCKPPPKGPGDSCFDMVFEPKCVEGYQCVDNFCVSAQLNMFGSEGQACSAQYTCEQGLSCAGGRCRSEFLREREYCGVSGGRATRSCNTGLQCIQNVCTRSDRVPPIARTLGAGQLCGLFASGRACGPGLQCTGSICRAAESQAVEPLLENGQAGCQFGTRRCKQGLMCINNVCVPQPSRTIGIGDYCGTDFPNRICVIGTECIDGVCVANPNTNPVVSPGPGEGQYCVPNGVPSCRQGFICKNNICTREAQTPGNRHPENCNQYLQMLAMRNPPTEQLELPHCISDGTWSPVQCDKFSCYCVDSMGTRLELYSVSRIGLNSAKEYMNCKCARDEAEYSKRGLNNDQWLYKCDKRGNYAALQCLHGSCFCGDHDGNPLIGQMSFQPGASNPANEDCSCARDKFNYEMYRLQRFPRLVENVFNCDTRGRYKMRCDVDFTGYIPLGNQAYVMCCCVNEQGVIRNQFGRNQCFRSIDINNGNWCQ